MFPLNLYCRIIFMIAVQRTFVHRQTPDLLSGGQATIAAIENKQEMCWQWDDYRGTYSYASEHSFGVVLQTIREIVQCLIGGASREQVSG